jgi:hypothetical protein
MGGGGSTRTHYSIIQWEEKFGNSAKMAWSQNNLPNIISNRKIMMNVIFWPQNFVTEREREKKQVSQQCLPVVEMYMKHCQNSNILFLWNLSKEKKCHSPVYNSSVHNAQWLLLL